MNKLSIAFLAMMLLATGVFPGHGAAGDLVIDPAQWVNLVGNSLTSGTIGTFYRVDPATGNKVAFSIPTGKTLVVTRVYMAHTPSTSIIPHSRVRLWAGSNSALGFYESAQLTSQPAQTTLELREELPTPWTTKVKFSASLYNVDSGVKLVNPGYLLVRVCGYLYPWP
jgi:hypothetical protein